MKVFAFVEKDTTVTMRTGRSYKGVSHDAVIGELRPHLIQNGILVAPTVISEEYSTVPTRNDGTMVFCRLKVQISFINVDDPKDRLECLAIGYGFDQGDKAPGKAFSYAVKTGILKTLSIEAGENDEERATQTANASVATPRKGPSEAQLKRLFAIAKQNGVANHQVDGLLGAKFKIKSKTELTRQQYDYICKLIDSKKFFDEFNKIPQRRPAESTPPNYPDAPPPDDGWIPHDGYS